MNNLFGCLLRKRVGKSHEAVNNNQRDPETSTKSHDLLAHRITMGVRSIGFFVQNLCDGNVGYDIPGTLDNGSIQVSNNREIYVWRKIN